MDHPPRPAAQRTEQEQADLARILDRCTPLRAVDQLVSDFAGMLHHRQGQHLDTWIANTQASGISQLHGFAAGLLKDYDAVRNGLTLTWSSDELRQFLTSHGYTSSTGLDWFIDTLAFSTLRLKN